MFLKTKFTFSQKRKYIRVLTLRTLIANWNTLASVRRPYVHPLQFLADGKHPASVYVRNFRCAYLKFWDKLRKNMQYFCIWNSEWIILWVIVRISLIENQKGSIRYKRRLRQEFKLISIEICLKAFQATYFPFTINSNRNSLVIDQSSSNMEWTWTSFF